MNEKVLKTLEYNKILNQLSEYACSPEAKKRCLALRPITDKTQIEQLQLQTKDALSRLFRCGNLSFSGVHSVNDSLKRLEIGASLSAAELLSICSLLEAAKRVKAFSRSEKEEVPDDSLTGFFTEIEPLTPLYDEIRRCIPAEDEIADDASSTLRSIRRSMRGMNDRIRAQMNNMINNSTTRSYLQDAVITMRDGRYCLPVKAEAKSQIPGMVHDQSSSGSTLFIEPMAVVNLNNEYKELLLKEKDEIEKILENLSNLTANFSEQIAADYTILAELDFIFAKAAYAQTYNGVAPTFNNEGYLHIKKGRHPLLDKKKVVPIDVMLGKDFKLLIVTGPNTGGKTVSLKTVGLLTLMGQSGLHIPAFEGSMLAVFNEVFADIGDEQSIEQSLSTFSAHMVNTVNILNEADENSLVLFDELGAGTDPVEGAALGISILSFLKNIGTRTMATTHYSELKLFALSTDGVENACCEFNVETLRPTYKLLIGIPGKSNAFAISSKLGLPDYIIDDAKKRIDSENEKFEDVIAKLEESKLTIEKDREEIAAYKSQIKSLKRDYELKNKRLDEQREKIITKAREEAVDILKDAKELADESIRTINQGSKSHNTKAMEKSRSKLGSKLKENQSGLSMKASAAKKKHKPSEFKIGTGVKVLSLNLKGTISTLPNANGDVNVQMGILNSKVNISDLEILDEPDVKAPGLVRSNTGKIKMDKAKNVKMELNLIGKTVDEAIFELDKYLDDAYIAHLPQVYIIHGKGTGALRSAIQNHLKNLSYVKSYRNGEHGEGGAGATVVTFK